MLEEPGITALRTSDNMSSTRNTGPADNEIVTIKKLKKVG
jgi:hypothetical protein